MESGMGRDLCCADMLNIVANDIFVVGAVQPRCMHNLYAFSSLTASLF